MRITYLMLPSLLLAACLPAMPGNWSHSSPPLPPPPPPAASALDQPVADPNANQSPPIAETHVRTSESSTESHTINGREMRGGGSSGGTQDLPRPSERQMKDLVRALEKLARFDRVKQFGTLIDPYYLTIDQLAVLVEPIPTDDRVRVVDIAVCSVVDPENAPRLLDAFPMGERDRALSAMGRQCFRKNGWDQRPPGKQGRHAAPPPGAYLLSSER